jgi:NAD+ kinase
MVLPPDGILEIRVSSTHRDMGLTIDGQLGYRLEVDDIIRVSRSASVTSLIKWKERTFFEVVRKKLQGNGGEDSWEDKK